MMTPDQRTELEDRINDYAMAKANAAASGIPYDRSVADSEWDEIAYLLDELEGQRGSVRGRRRSAAARPW